MSKPNLGKQRTVRGAYSPDFKETGNTTSSYYPKGGAGPSLTKIDEQTYDGWDNHEVSRDKHHP